MSLFSLELLPAGDGDCLLLSWGDAARLSHMVVDGGRAGAYPHLKARLAEIARNGGTLELYVLTHIDADHIEGALAYLKDSDRPIDPKQVWYNGRLETTSAGARSMTQGDSYANLLSALGWPWNASFVDGVARIGSAPDGLEIAGLRITMLSPDDAHLAALGSQWSQWHERQTQGLRVRGATVKAAKRPPPPDPLVVEELLAPGLNDTDRPNGSSIAFVAEWEGRRILFGADAHPDLLAASLRPLAEAEGGRYRVDLYKASHHGSAKNNSGELIGLLDCRRMAISTNGHIHCHPDPETIARFLHFGPTGHKDLYFNYVTGWTRPWTSPEVGRRYGFEAHVPPAGTGTMRIDLLDKP